MTHVLRNYLNEKGLITVQTSQDNKYFKLYEHGVAQPGVLCVRPDASVIYSWAIIPSEVKSCMNLLSMAGHRCY